MIFCYLVGFSLIFALLLHNTRAATPCIELHTIATPISDCQKCQTPATPTAPPAAIYAVPVHHFVCVQFRKVLCVHSGYSSSSGVWHEKCILLGLFLYRVLPSDPNTTSSNAAAQLNRLCPCFAYLNWLKAEANAQNLIKFTLMFCFARCLPLILLLEGIMNLSWNV